MAEEKEAALKREREEALKRAENEMTDLERRGVGMCGQSWHGVSWLLELLRHNLVGNLYIYINMYIMLYVYT